MLHNNPEATRRIFQTRDPAAIQEAVEANQLAIKAFGAEKVNRDTHEITFIGTQDSVDRDSERVLPKAFEKDIGHYLQNPVVLFNHNPREPAVGRMVDYEITEKQILMRVKFAVDENPMANVLWKLYSADPPYMRMVSMAFLPLEATDKASEKLPGQKNMTYTRVEMLELSLVNIGANRYAMSMLSKDFQGDPLMKSIYARVQRGLPNTIEGGNSKMSYTQKVVILEKGMTLSDRLKAFVENAPEERSIVIEKLAESANLEEAMITQILDEGEGDLRDWDITSKHTKAFARTLGVHSSHLSQNGKHEEVSTKEQESEADEEDDTKKKYYYSRYSAVRPKGSFEKIRGQLTRELESYLPLKLPNIKQYNYVDFDILGTFTDKVILCCYNYSMNFEAIYEVGYEIDAEGKVTFADEMVEVEQQFVTKS